MKNGFPQAGIDQVVGLFGGSFDPPHPGHVHVTHAALRAFGLDRVWWLVSPGNPLKSRGPAGLDRRLRAAREVMRHPRVAVTGLEAQLGTRATADTLRRLRAIYPRVRFVWLMGADNLTQFHRWKDWRYIIETVPVGVLARPGDRLPARLSVAAKTYAQYRLDAQASRMLGRAEAPAWCFVNVPLIDESSTRIRSSGDWSGP